MLQKECALVLRVSVHIVLPIHIQEKVCRSTPLVTTIPVGVSYVHNEPSKRITTVEDIWSMVTEEAQYKKNENNNNFNNTYCLIYLFKWWKYLVLKVCCSWATRSVSNAICWPLNNNILHLPQFSQMKMFQHWEIFSKNRKMCTKYEIWNITTNSYKFSLWVLYDKCWHRQID